ncbi:hypothetical protein PG985_007648 [Apiospora marii]|uniref:Uncharacterized protein n=1 Tax=Apiospora marii TaxID=335849 RepID=A0ABR1SQH6_9PEZI
MEVKGKTEVPHVVRLALIPGGTLREIFSSPNEASVVSKLILEFGPGFYLPQAPMATFEISPVVLCSIATASVNLGQFLYNAVFFCAALLSGLPFAPESAFSLLRGRRRDETRKANRALYGTRIIGIDIKLAILERTIAEELSSPSLEKGGIRQCFRGTTRLAGLDPWRSSHFWEPPQLVQRRPLRTPQRVPSGHAVACCYDAGGGHAGNYEQYHELHHKVPYMINPDKGSSSASLLNRG